MICDPCRDAGRYNKEMILAAEARSLNESEEFHLAAIRRHQRCEARTTCPCQHRTGQLVKQEAQ